MKLMFSQEQVFGEMIVDSEWRQSTLVRLRSKRNRTALWACFFALAAVGLAGDSIRAAISGSLLAGMLWAASSKYHADLVALFIVDTLEKSKHWPTTAGKSTNSSGGVEKEKTVPPETGGPA